jgi:hypothetical protein
LAAHESPPQGASGLAGAAEEAAAGYQQAGSRIAALATVINEAVSAATEGGRQAGAAAVGVRDTALSQAGPESKGQKANQQFARLGTRRLLRRRASPNALCASSARRLGYETLRHSCGLN